ncbi:MAG: FtsQ-type POTRA domain-containing protein [Desulfobulbaceae bacterium]|jgi:cell division septal protein FtsQ|nr:FtsQ-type POTRA domain-containing protein [Desulfobulbaceae bacterium]
MVTGLGDKNHAKRPRTATLGRRQRGGAASSSLWRPFGRLRQRLGEGLSPRRNKARRHLGRSGFASSPIETERRRAKTMRMLTIFFASACVIVLIGLSGPRFFWDSLTSLSCVRVSALRIHGVSVVEPKRIRDLSGIIENRASMLTIDKDGAIRRILADPWISDVTISRDWLDMAVDITVTENHPMALVNRQSDGGPVLWYADGKGDGFLPMKVGQDADYPVISGLDFLPNTAERQEALATIMGLLKKAARVTKDAKQTNLYLTTPAISEILVTPEKKLVLFLVDYPFPIFLGKDTEKQFRYLADTLEKLYGSMKNVNITDIVAIELSYYGEERIRLIRKISKDTQRGDSHAG